MAKRILPFVSLVCTFSVLAGMLFSAQPVLPVSAAPLPGEIVFLTGANSGEPLEIAFDYVRQRETARGLSQADLADVIVTDQYTSASNGVTHIYLRQRYQGLEILEANININIARNGAVVNMGGAFASNLAAPVNARTPAVSAGEAVSAAARHLSLPLEQALTVRSRSNNARSETIFEGGSLSMDPIRVGLAYHLSDTGKLRLAWNMQISQLDGEHHWDLLVDAHTRAVLSQTDYVDHDNWGSPAANDWDVSAAAAGLSAASLQGSAQTQAYKNSKALTSASYNVFPLPLESPLDGPRSLVANPENLTASPFGWHDTNGVEGPEFTTTRGNNVDAFLDKDNNNAPDPNGQPEGGAGLSFDFPLDLNLGPDTYTATVVTNLFYWNNILHDVFYQYGFDEPAGNFQFNNYGNAGQAGDYVEANAQDGGGTNNANFGTPPDGFRPRMQMFIWTAPSAELTVTAPGAIAGVYQIGTAAFGPQVFDLTGSTVLVNDGTGASTMDACEPIVNNISSQIALIDRGTCAFVIKVKNAQNAGAIGAIIMNNAPGGGVLNMAGTDPTITIPAVLISYENGQIFRNSTPLPTVHLVRAFDQSRDSDLDNGVIAHEYAHGISNRLVGGPSNTACLSNQEQMGEGWSDFVALVLTTDPADTAVTSRGIGNYVVFSPSTGRGIRPTAYTTDMSINPTTYGNIPGLAVPHGVGYAWATMLWDMYWSLVDKHGYNPDVYADWTTGGNNLAIQLVIDGMKLANCNPGFVDGRDAIIIADVLLTGGENYCDIWGAFADRGLGYSASQGSSFSSADGTEAFDLPASCNPKVQVDKSELNSTPLLGSFQELPLQITNANVNLEGNTSSTTEQTILQAPAPVTSSHSAGQDNPNNYKTATFTTTVEVSNTLFLNIGICCTANPSDDLDLYIEDSGGNLLAQSASPTSNEQITLENPTDGTYTVYVHGYDVPGSTTTFDLLQQALPLPSVAPPNTYSATAIEISFVQVLKMMSFDSAKGSDIDLYLLDSNEHIVAKSTSETDQETIWYITPPDDTYTLIGLGVDVPGGSDTFQLTVSRTNSVGAELSWEISEAPVACDATGDVPWLSVSPHQGTISAGGSAEAKVRFTPEGLKVGPYNSVLCITSNDPANPLIEVQANMLFRLLFLSTIHKP